MKVTSIYPEGGIAVFNELGYNLVRLEINPGEYSYWAFNEFTAADEKNGTSFHYIYGREVTQYLETITSAQGTPEMRRKQIMQEMDNLKLKKCQLHHSHKWIQFLV